MNTIRTLTAATMVPVMMLTGFRFSKEYRRGETRFKRAIYACVNTVQANIWSGI